MSFIGNLFWILFGGWIAALGWFVVGLLWCITIIGIPIGLQCFKFSALSLFPFGKEVYVATDTPKVLINVLWIIFGGIELAFTHLVIGIILYITIIGIPFGKQHFKLAKLALFPVGAKVRRPNHYAYDRPVQ